MKYRFTLAVLLLLLVSIANGQTTKTVGGTSPNYATLQAAFAAINSGAIQGQIILQITGSTTESASAVLKGSGTGAANYTSVLIYPTATFSITATTLTPSFGNFALIDLDGADNVTIDGRINQTGSPNSLTIINTSIGNAATAIRFVNSAENNIVKYCNHRASSASSSMGILTFGGSNTGNGNDNNIVEYCDLTNPGTNRPYNGIVSSGTSGRENSGDIIRNNNIYNTFQTGVSSNGININNASIGFTISGNSIYETIAFEATATALAYNAIRVSTSNEHTVSGNYIGGTQPLCAGTAWLFTAHRAVYFCAIYVSAGNGTATSIANNTIANIYYSSKDDNPWDGIFLNTGNFEVSGNTIGATTGTGSITLKTPVPLATTTLNGGVVTAVTILYGGSDYPTTPPAITFTSPPAGGTAPTATATVSGGVVTGITIVSQGSGYTTAPAVIFDGQSNNYSTSHGMIQASTGTVNITGNNLGSITTVGSNFYSHGFESIYVRTIATATSLTNNLIGSLETANSIHVSSAAASSLIKQDVYGIYCASTLTTIISGNTVANLTNAYAGLNSGARTRGIQTTAGSNTVSNNTVYTITSASKQSAGGSQASSIGISQLSTTTETTQIISGNSVYDIKNTNPTDKSFVRGIYCTGPTSGSHTISGNFVHSISIGSTDYNSDITGIDLAGGNFTCANNIVNLGTGISGGYVINGIWDESGTGLTRSAYFNSVYIVGTVTSGASATCAFRNQFTGTRDYRNNILFNARLGDGKHYAVYLQAANSLTVNYNDYLANGTNGVLGYLGSDKATLALLQTATGQDANSKDINPVFTLPGGTSAINYYPSATLTGTTISGITTDYYGITRGATPKMGALEQNGNVWQGATSTDFNTASNWANNLVPASGEDIIFATSPTNNCVLDANRTLGSITNGSSKNLLVNGKTLTVGGSINFTSSGKISTSTALSVVKFAGSTGQIIPAAAFVSNSVAGLEIANSNGVGLNGALTVSAALTLSSGVLTIGANTLTYSGSSPISAGGTVDASNASADIVFANASAIELPVTFFASAVNNLFLSGAGGVTSGGDFTVNGILNLQSANPSTLKGILDMRDGSTITTLTLGENATITGTSDVTGIVKRQHAFITNMPYTFGSQVTTIAFLDDGSRPEWISLKISIGAAPGWSSWSPLGKVKRYYNIAVSDNSATAKAVVNMRYLLSELDGTNNDESKLVFWHKFINFDSGKPHEHGKSNQDFEGHSIGVTGIMLSGAATEVLDNSEIALAYSLTTKNTWKGEVAGSETKWEIFGNWTAGHVPLSTEDVLIPSGLANYPSLTASSNATALSIEIESGASITANDYDIIIKGFQGAWINDGNFYPGTGKVTFNHGVPADIVTISGITNFYDIEAGENTSMQPVAGCILRIAGTGTAYPTSIVDFSTIDNTVEWNGSNQTIVNPSGLNGHSGFYNLVLSGSGTKTMPSSAMNIRGNLTLAGTASATSANAFSIDGNLLIETWATFGTGTFSHQIKGNITCDGTLTPGTGSTITMNGSLAQSIQGVAATPALGGLTISNTSGVTLYNNATTAVLNISSGAFTVSAGKSVTASGSTTLGSAQCLVLKSDETGTASFIDNGTISGSGTARIERYLIPYDEVTDLKFHFISSPVSTTQAIETEFIDLSSTAITDFYKWDEQINYWINYRGGSYNSYNSAFGYNFEPGKGYMVAYPDVVTKYFVGTTSTGNVTATCTHDSGGWNLIGNPYPSSVDWDLVSKGNGMDAALYYYDNATPGYKYYVWFSGPLGATASKYIAPMQGVMVHAASSGTKTVTFSNNARTHSGQDVFYKSASLTNNILDLKVEGNNKTDYARVCFYDQATENFDGDYDAYKLFSYSETASELYTLTNNNTSLAINTLPEKVMEGGIVPVNFKVGLPGNYAITAERINSFDAKTDITLEDKLMGTLQKLNDNPVYNFTATSLDADDRFVLHFTIITSVPQTKDENTFNISISNSVVKVDAASASATGKIKITDMTGRTVALENLASGASTLINLNVKPGVYMVSVYSASNVYSRKVVVY